jgi:hypothetical protein
VRLLVFREEGWDGRLMLVLVLVVEEKEEKMGSGGLGLDGNVVAVVGEPHDWLHDLRGLPGLPTATSAQVVNPFFSLHSCRPS